MEIANFRQELRIYLYPKPIHFLILLNIRLRRFIFLYEYSWSNTMYIKICFTLQSKSGREIHDLKKRFYLIINSSTISEFLNSTFVILCSVLSWTRGLWGVVRIINQRLLSMLLSCGAKTKDSTGGCYGT